MVTSTAKMSPTYDQPLSLAFRSAVRSASQSPDPWSDIESSLLVSAFPFSDTFEPSDVFFFSGVILITVILTRLRSYIATNRHYKEQVTQLVHVALQQLAQHATDNPTEPWVGAVQLRDQVLQHEFNPQRRKKLWDGVQKIVEMNSNVRAGEREISGEVMRVWTWIGGRISSARMANGVGSIGEMEGNGGEFSGKQPVFSRVIV